MTEKEDLDKYFKTCRKISKKKRAKKEAKRQKKLMMKGLSRTQRLILKGKGVLHSLDTISKRAAKFDIEELHDQEKRLVGKGKKKKDQDKATNNFLKGL